MKYVGCSRATIGKLPYLWEIRNARKVNTSIAFKLKTNDKCYHISARFCIAVSEAPAFTFLLIISWALALEKLVKAFLYLDFIRYIQRINH